MLQTKLALFEWKEIRKIWNSEIWDWYFSVVDVIEVLTDSINPTDYLKKLRKRDIELWTYHRNKLSPGRNENKYLKK